MQHHNSSGWDFLKIVTRVREFFFNLSVALRQESGRTGMIRLEGCQKFWSLVVLIKWNETHQPTHPSLPLFSKTWNTVGCDLSVKCCHAGCESPNREIPQNKKVPPQQPRPLDVQPLLCGCCEKQQVISFAFFSPCSLCGLTSGGSWLRGQTGWRAWICTPRSHGWWSASTAAPWRSGTTRRRSISVSPTLLQTNTFLTARRPDDARTPSCV